MKSLAWIPALVCFTGLAIAQAPAPAPPPQQINMQTLAEMMRAAQSFNELVRNMNLKAKLGPDVHTPGPDGIPEHSGQRTAATIGAGAGVGSAIGGMTHAKNGVLIGALIGSAGGLIVDEIVKHREKAREAQQLSTPPEPLNFKQRPIQ